MDTTSIGKTAERIVASYFQKLGYTIIAYNWRTASCEIDIVAQHRKRMHFIEVKYRKTNAAGSGLAYITPKKLAQMRYAAETWVHSNNWRHDYSLAVVSVSGSDFRIDDVLMNIG